MSKLPIVTIPAAGLREKTRPVTRFDADLQRLIDDMVDTMRQANGVGLAAPQIGLPIKLAVIETLPEEDDDGNEIEGTRDLFVVVNPEIYWMSKETMKGLEGCLSIPGYIGEVERAESIRVRGLDRHGRKFRLRFDDWDARIFQHEIDHLNGILYIDKLTAPENIWTEEEFEAMRAARQENTDEEQSAVVGD
ncbi:MAG: peptide deformylase [Anaerolineae bacterium]|nr:peptide deformylase [Anaerolineae bacterium]RIK23616.1 MAG: peptide deformylase [Anaerolineae bacterium]